ncbi:uncharacterized protein PAC_06236 [Phialocephala subalpina]|uniref:BTB domain-containing protein n=1 Tax=Phialocephala subalpina TaxID=576137 RepID=A0A1L7WUB5_9HELO|nr:uncharacterized protein PAC_06236 [Phialocephala subalpina]
MADLLSSIKGLLESERYADLILRCNGETFRVHCAVVCTRSPFLTRAAELQQFKEASLREIDLSADELPTIRAMIRYLYTDDYPDDAGKQDDCASLASICTPEDEDEDVATPLPIVADPAFPLLFNVKMYIAGNKFSIPGLKTLATNKYRACVTEHWDSPIFSEAATHLWTKTNYPLAADRQLRDVVVEAAFKHLTHFLKRDEFVDLMKSHGDFGLDIVKLIDRHLFIASSHPPATLLEDEMTDEPAPSQDVSSPVRELSPAPVVEKVKGASKKEKMREKKKKPKAARELIAASEESPEVMRDNLTLNPLQIYA